MTALLPDNIFSRTGTLRIAWIGLVEKQTAQGKLAETNDSLRALAMADRALRAVTLSLSHSERRLVYSRHSWRNVTPNSVAPSVDPLGHM